eukprot:1195921-Prorocentrum_minimum.AAC.3
MVRSVGESPCLPLSLALVPSSNISIRNCCAALVDKYHPHCSHARAAPRLTTRRCLTHALVCPEHMSAPVRASGRASLVLNCARIQQPLQPLASY